MTIIVGIRCTDGVVIGADSSVTFGPTSRQSTIEQSTDRKIEIIGDQVIVAGTGFVGHQQRFTATVKELFDKKEVWGKNTLGIGRGLSAAGVADFSSTKAPMSQYAALVAYKSTDHDFNLCEFSAEGFQPEIKELGGLWWVSIGSGQMIVDPFMALLQKAFWKDGPPTLRGGTFTALWALEHACELNTGGIQKPIHIATLGYGKNEKGKVRASKLDADALAEHANMIGAATERLGSFRDVLKGAVDVKEVPKLDKPAGILPGLPGAKPPPR